MISSGRKAAGQAVAVYGAAGHTGRFVVAELLRRGVTPIAVARDLATLTSATFPGHEVLRRQASVVDPESLDRALAGTQAVINCAGPFLETADAVAAAAVRIGIHYLDVTAEQSSAQALLDKYHTAARQAGIAVVPAMGFYGGFADLLVTAALGDWDRADSAEIMIGLDSWHPTRGTRLTGERNTAQRVVVVGGQLTPLRLPPREHVWEFGEPLGLQAVVEEPFSEIIVIARHVRLHELHTYLNNQALSDVRDPKTPAPRPVDSTGRSSQRFMVDTVVRRGGQTRRTTAHGQDIYAFTAPLICEAVAHLLEGKFRNAGALPPGVLFDARAVLSALAPDHLALSDWPPSIPPDVEPRRP